MILIVERRAVCDDGVWRWELGARYAFHSRSTSDRRSFLPHDTMSNASETLETS